MSKSSLTVPRPKVTVYFNQDVYDWLTEKADLEVRSVANLVEYLVIKMKDEQINSTNDTNDPKSQNS